MSRRVGNLVGSNRTALTIVPWLGLCVAFLVAYAWIRRDWVWIVGDDQNLMMPAINIGRGLVPNIDFVNGYPGLTFYVQRAIMMVVGDLPISEHVYTAIQASLFAVVAAWVLRRQVPAALTWILIFFVWTVSYRLNPTPNPGNVMQTLVILSMYWMGRFGRHLRLRDAVVGGSLAGLAFLFKQPAIFVPIVFLVYSSYAYLAWADRTPSRRLRTFVVVLNVAVLVAFGLLYMGASVFGVLDDPGLREGMLFSTAVFMAPWVVAVLGLCMLPGRVPAIDRPVWSFELAARANVVFVAGFVLVSGIGLMAMYGSPERIALVLRAVFVDAPQSINGGQSKLMQPLLLWPTVAIAVLVVLSPFVIGAVRSWPLRLVVFAAACAGCLHTALTYSDLQFTIVATLLFFLMTAVFLLRRPTDPDSWNRFFIFLGGSCLLAYLAPHPKILYSLGILAVTGWHMLGSAAPKRWPPALNVAGFGALLGIAVLTLQWAQAEAEFITPFRLGTHTVRSYDSTFPAAVDAARASTLDDWVQNRYDYLVYLVRAP